MKKIVTEATTIGELEILKAKHGVSLTLAQRDYAKGTVSVCITTTDGVERGEGESLAEALNDAFNKLTKTVAKKHYSHAL